MSIIEFATNKPTSARRFLDGVKMDYLTEDTKNFIIDGVERGLCRVRDPFMYGGSSGVVPTGYSDEISEFMAEVRERTTWDYKNRPQEVVLSPKDLPDGYRIKLTHWERKDGRKERFEAWVVSSSVFDIEDHMKRVREHIAKHGEGSAGLCWRIVGPSIDAELPTEADILGLISLEDLNCAEDAEFEEGDE